MLAALAWTLVVIVALAALVVVLGRATLPALPSSRDGGRLPSRQRAEVARAVADARWVAGHDERDGVTRVLLRRSCTGPDGLPMVLEEREFTSFASDDPLWEAKFTEAMAQARFRCDYLNTEEAGG